MKYTIIILLLLAVFLAITNPKLEQHEQEIQNHVAKNNTLSSMLGSGFLSSKIVEYKNWAVLSTTRYDDSLVTVGLLSNIWIIPDNKLMQ